MKVGFGLVLVAVLGWAVPVSGQEAEVSSRPRFTPFTQKPELRSAEATAAALKAMYPSQLREAGVGGTSLVWLFIDRTGEVKKVELFRSSGFDALDAAALRVAEEMKFTPALNRDRAVDVWIQLPVKFSPEEHRRPERAVVRPSSQASPEEIAAAPRFTPYTEAPMLANKVEIADALRANYPPLLRDAGIGGTAAVWTLIDEAGVVVKTQLARTSGHEALDRAALRVAGAMDFHPARNRDRDVMAWVQIPVTFKSN